MGDDPRTPTPSPRDSGGADWGGRVDVPIPERDRRTGRWNVHPPSRAEVDTPYGTLGADVPHGASDTPSGEEHQHIRHRVDLLQQWTDHLRHAHDRATIIQGVVGALRAADAAAAGGAGRDTVHELDATARAWESMAEGSGSAETFQAARDDIVPALDRLLMTLRNVRDSGSRRERNRMLHNEVVPDINHLDLATDQARYRVSNGLSQAGLAEFAAAIANLQSKTEPGDIIAAAILLFTALSDALYGNPEFDSTLVEERGEWSVLHGYSGVPARFQAARDQLVTAANGVHQALGPWIGSPPTLENGQQFSAVLIYASQQARGLLSHLTEHAVSEYKEAINHLTSAGNDSAAIAAAVSSTLEQADRVFHDQATPLDGAVAAEMAAWTNVGTSAGDAGQLDAARDQFATAAHEFLNSLEPHLYHLVDESTRGQLLHPLVQAATQARQHLGHH